MADALKKGIAAKFLLPMVGAYIAAAAALSAIGPCRSDSEAGAQW